MAESRNFRNALNGFNREDVVRYIEEMNNRHNTLVNQLRSEKQSLADALADLQSKNNVPSITVEEYESLQQELAALRAEVEILRAAPAPAPAPAVAPIVGNTQQVSSKPDVDGGVPAETVAVISAAVASVAPAGTQYAVKGIRKL